MIEHVDEMRLTVGETLQSEPDGAAQRKWLRAENTGQRVTAIISMDMRRMSSDAIDTVASGLTLMASKMEKGLRSINQFSKSWPVGSLVVWAPDIGGGSQLELQEEVMSSDAQQMVMV